jgi:hypothetical protein
MIAAISDSLLSSDILEPMVLHQIDQNLFRIEW